MDGFSPEIVGLAAALGVGLLIGIERERSKGTGPGRRPGGIRTFALFALAGAIAAAVDSLLLVPATVLAAAAFATVAYQRSADTDPGLTTEIALVVTTLLGVLSYRQPEIGAGLGPFAGKAWRIGLMGHASSRRNVDLVLTALEQLLAENSKG